MPLASAADRPSALPERALARRYPPHRCDRGSHGLEVITSHPLGVGPLLGRPARDARYNHGEAEPQRRRAAAFNLEAHARFHRLITAGAGPPLRRQLTDCADRTIRYFRVRQLPEPASWQTHGEVEHAAMLTVLAQHDDAAALSG